MLDRSTLLSLAVAVGNSQGEFKDCRKNASRLSRFNGIRTTMRSVFLASAALAVVALASSDQLAFRLPAADSIASTLSLEHAIYSTLSASDALQLAAHIDSLPEQRTVRFANGQEMTISEGEKALLSYQSIRYMDVTDEEVYLRTQAVRESSN